MKRKNNLSPLPFYTDLIYQNQNEWYAYGKLFTTNYQAGFVPPFQLIIPDAVEAVGMLPTSYFDVVQIYNLELQFNIDVKDTMIADQLLTAEKFAGGYIVIKNVSANILNPPNWNPSSLPDVFTNIPREGNHFLKIVIGGVAYCSEQFSWKSTIQDQIQLRYRHNEDFLHSDGHIDYSLFQHIINLKSSLGKPKYEFEEDVQKREGYSFPVYQISYKTYRFQFFAPEYLLDALRIVFMHDFVEIEYQGETFQVDNILFTESWEEQGDLASVVCEFTSDTVVAISARSTGSLDAVTPPVPPPTPPGGDDYGTDFNNDYANL